MSTLRTNALEGVDAKNSITIVAGAGNITTTNVQEGLAKAWCSLNGTGTIALRDSFNISSITDAATGQYTSTLSNIMANASYCFQGTSGFNVGSSGDICTTLNTDSDPTTSAAKSLSHVGGTGNDVSFVFHSYFGDLA